MFLNPRGNRLRNPEIHPNPRETPMNNIIKLAAVAALTITSASAFAWGNGPFNGFNNGFGDMANQVFGDGAANGNADFNMSMSGSANGSGRGYGRGYDRFQGYNGYGYAPNYGYVPNYAAAPYYGGGYPTAGNPGAAYPGFQGAPGAMMTPPPAPAVPQAQVAQ